MLIREEVLRFLLSLNGSGRHIQDQTYAGSGSALTGSCLHIPATVDLDRYSTGPEKAILLNTILNNEIEYFLTFDNKIVFKSPSGAEPVLC